MRLLRYARNDILWLLLLTTLVSRLTLLYGAFQQTSLSVPAKGLGGAYVGLADDASAMFINPAGVANITHKEAAFSYGKPFYGLPGIDLSQGYISLTFPTLYGSIGLGGTNFAVADLMTESTWSLVYAKKVHKVQFGIGASYLSHSFNLDSASQQDVVLAKGTSKDAYGIDFGLLAQPLSFLSLGFSVRHANEPNVGFFTKDPVPREVRWGGAVKYRSFDFLADANYRDNGIGSRSDHLSYHFGIAENIPNAPITLRLGANTKRELTTGFGFGAQGIRIDYAFVFSRDLYQDNMGSHLLSLSYRWQ